MKKLALALVCLIGVAFFASCDPTVEHPEPTIAILAQEGYLVDGQTIEVDVDYPFGFQMASNAETQKELSRFVLYLEGNDEPVIDTAISGTEFTIEALFEYPSPERLVIDPDYEIRGVVYDVAGETASATITLIVNQEENLEVKDITWVRRGANAQNADEMAEYGLQWLGRAPFANIRPMDGCTLYVIENAADEYASVETASDKAAYFADLQETARPVDEYRNIDVNIGGDTEYNDILAVIDKDGYTHLILFAKANIQTGNYGTQTTITGMVK